jgi:hypothetical protein
VDKLRNLSLDSNNLWLLSRGEPGGLLPIRTRICRSLSVLTQELIRHTEVELVADTILVEVEGVIAIRESDALDV